MRRETHETDRFYAVDESGNRYEIIEWTQYLRISSFAAPEEVKEGLKEYETTSGEAVNRLGENEFAVLISAAVGEPETLIVHREP